ncbi:MAG: glycosyltransferase [Peptococcaceae bacterium]|nr:glycosyltransferase [Peptococcaceae bacterium]
MKVLVISHMYPSQEIPVSGIFVRKQTEALVGAGVEAVVINPVPWAPFFLRWHPRWRRYANALRREENRGGTVLRPRYVEFPKGFLFASTPGRYYRGMAPTLRNLLKEWRPDIIHAHVAFPDGAAAVRFGEEYGIPVVVTVHGMDFLATLKRGPACERCVKQTLVKADRVILVSEVLRENFGLEQWIDDVKKCRVIYNGVHLDDVITSKQVDVSGDGSRFAPVLLTVGNLTPKKGQAYVLKALPALLEHFPHLIYKIVGDGEERSKLEHLADELEVREHVSFLGALSHQEAMREMADCDVMVMPSWDEGFGIVYLEAMAHGKPVIGTQGEGAAGLIEKEDVGLTVPAGDAAAIARASNRILSSRELACAMGQRGQEIVSQQLTWNHNAERTMDLYQDVLKDYKREYS